MIGKSKPGVSTIRASSVVNRKSYQAGEEVVFDIPRKSLDCYGYKVSMSRDSWPDGVNCTLENGVVQSNVAAQVIFERSADGNAWSVADSCTFQGGSITKRNGQPLTEAVWSPAAVLAGQKVLQNGHLRLRAKFLVALQTELILHAEDV